MYNWILNCSLRSFTKTILASAVCVSFMGLGAFRYLQSIEAAETNTVKITFLGTGHPRIDSNYIRFQAGIVFDLGEGETWLLDCGLGVVANAFKAGYPPESIKYVYLSHLHCDHILDVDSFIFTRFVNQLTPEMRSREIPREPSKIYGPLYVFGVPGTTEFIKTMMVEAYKADGRPPNQIDASNYYDITEIGTDWKKEFSGYKVSVCNVVHSTLDTRAIRFDVGGKSIVYSGDVGPPSDPSLNQDLVKLAHNCDLLIFDGLHFALTDIGTIAKDINAKKLIITHVSSDWRLEQVYIMMNSIKKIYPGDIILAEDMMSIDI